jgi:hypothetical protein
MCGILEFKIPTKILLEGGLEGVRRQFETPVKMITHISLFCQ